MTGCEPSVFCCLRACFTGGKQGLFEAGMQGYITMRSWELWAVCTEAQQDVRDKDTGLSPWRETWNFSKCWGQNKAEKQDLTFFSPVPTPWAAAMIPGLYQPIDYLLTRTRKMNSQFTAGHLCCWYLVTFFTCCNLKEHHLNRGQSSQ